VSYGYVLPESDTSEASKGFFHSLGGFLFGEVITWPKNEPTTNWLPSSSAFYWGHEQCIEAYRI